MLGFEIQNGKSIIHYLKPLFVLIFFLDCNGQSDKIIRIVIVEQEDLLLNKMDESLNGIELFRCWPFLSWRQGKNLTL